MKMSASIPRETIAARLAELGYIADRDLSVALWMMDYLQRPLLIEGEAGVGKTEVAKALAAVHDAGADPPAMLRGSRRQRSAI